MRASTELDRLGAMKGACVGRGGLVAASCALLLGCPSKVVETGEASSATSSTSASTSGAGGSTSTTSSSSASTSGTGGSNACAGHVYYAGMYPQAGEMLAPSVWAQVQGAAGLTGLDAGNSVCQSLGIGADHVCDLTEIQAAAAAHEPLLSAIPQGTTAWLQRTTPVYVEGLSGVPCTAAMDGQADPNAGDMCVTFDGGVLPCVCALSPPGPGGNCNGWTYEGTYIGDGEYYSFDQQGVVTYHFDNDTIWDPGGPDPESHSHPWDDLKCGGSTRAILCCYASCTGAP
jgi:hypothetical protein